MKYFKVVFLPNGRESKEWMVWQAASIDELKKFFISGTIISITEILKKEYEEYVEDI